ncbi:MAG: peptide chain release factor 1 [Clostridiales bacterium]|nr:peptide chain release factor 1 [Clostridiales bacterium]
MREHFAQLAARYEELALTVAQPETIQDQPRFQALMREMAELEPLLAAWNDYDALLREVEATRTLLEDPGMKELAQEELDSLERRLGEQEEGLRQLLLPRDEDDERDVVMEVRAGAGGEEAALFGALLLRMYTRYAERAGFTYQLMSISESDIGGVREAVFTISGKGAFSRLKYESGVHRIQRVPTTESAGRIHTSTATVAVLPVLEDVQVDINPGDLRVDVYRSSGKGGQHVNTTDSAVRITHLPTGLVVACQNERSQLKNHETALKLLKLRLYERAREERDAAHAGQRKSQVGSGDRSERIRTYNYPQGRVTDHRIGLTLYQIEFILDGDLDPLIEPLALHERQQQLAQQG